MKVKYLSYQQAVALYNDYQHLVGHRFEKDQDESIVRKILVAPYSPILQWQFLRHVNRGIPPDEALAMCKVGRFDVILLCEKTKNEQGGFLFKDLRSYLSEHSHPFDIARYN